MKIEPLEKEIQIPIGNHHFLGAVLVSGRVSEAKTDQNSSTKGQGDPTLPILVRVCTECAPFNFNVLFAPFMVIVWLFNLVHPPKRDM